MMDKETRLDGMLSSAPDYYQESKVYYAILERWAAELTDIDADNDDLALQLYIQTCTWAIDIWEKEYAVIPDPGAGLEARRAKVLAKIQGLGTFTKNAALGLANVYSQAKTAKYFSRLGEYEFKTQHEVDDLVDLEGLKASFDLMQPAHLLHIIGLLIRVNMAPNVGGKVRATLRVLLREQFTNVNLKTRLIVTGETPGSSKYQAPFVNGVKNSPYTLFWNGAWDWNGYYKMDGQNPDGALLYNRQSETLTIYQIDKASGQVVQTWKEVDRPK